MTFTFNRDKDVTPDIPVLILIDPYNILDNPKVTIPEPQLHPRRVFDALMEMGADGYIPWTDLIQLAYWLSGTEIPSSALSAASHVNIELSFGIRVTYLNHRDLSIEGPRH